MISISIFLSPFLLESVALYARTNLDVGSSPLCIIEPVASSTREQRRQPATTDDDEDHYYEKKEEDNDKRSQTDYAAELGFADESKNSSSKADERGASTEKVLLIVCTLNSRASAYCGWPNVKIWLHDLTLYYTNAKGTMQHFTTVDGRCCEGGMKKTSTTRAVSC